MESRKFFFFVAQLWFHLKHRHTHRVLPGATRPFGVDYFLDGKAEIRKSAKKHPELLTDGVKKTPMNGRK